MDATWPTTVEHVPPLVYAPLFGGVLWWLALALGTRLLKLARVASESLSAIERGFVGICLGAGVLQFLPYVLGLFHELNRVAIGVALGALALLLHKDLFSVARGVCNALRRVWRARQLTPPTLVWSSLAVVLLGVYLIVTVTLTAFGEDDGYHLSAPRRWLHAQTLGYLPTYTLTNAAMGFEMFYVMALAFLDAAAAKFLHFSAGTLSLVGLFLCVRRVASVQAGLLAVSVLLIPNPLWDLTVPLPRPYVDLAVCWMLTGSILAWLAWQKHQDTKLLICAALCVGFAGSFKATAIAASLAWLPPVALELRRQGGAWSKVVKQVILFGALAGAPVLPWFARNWWLLGDPLFPMLSKVLPTRDWPIEHAEIFSKYIRYFTWGIAEPRSVEERRVLILLGLLVAIVLTALVVYRMKQPALRALCLFAGGFVVISIALTGLIVRYWLPAIFVGALVASVLVMHWLESRKWHRWLAPVALAVACGLTLKWALPTLPSGVRLATGWTTLDEEHAASPFWNTWQTINTKTPPDAHVLMAAFYTTFGSSSYGGVWVDRVCFTTDSQLQAYIRFDSWESFIKSLQRAGITHMVIGERQYNVGRIGFSFPAADNEYPFCRRLADEYGERMTQFGDVQLYRIFPEKAQRAAREAARLDNETLLGGRFSAP